MRMTEGLAKEVGPLGIHVTLVELAGFNPDFGSSSKFPAKTIPDYAPARDVMIEFDKQAVRGNLAKSMAAVARITGIDEPPLHLVVATAGLEMVRGHFAPGAHPWRTPAPFVAAAAGGPELGMCHAKVAGCR
ncbi:hypothetical protein ACFRAO_39195 [Streptomyces sp. NPDC056656]|uniref:hypothetical protein n=1 Tax=Streptomyces sp. NPDC056656 TaxID=3345895 RepID=UPI0036BE70C0